MQDGCDSFSDASLACQAVQLRAGQLRAVFGKALVFEPVPLAVSLPGLGPTSSGMKQRRRCLVATLAFQSLGRKSAQPGVVVVPLTRQRRHLPDSWGRRQSTVEYFAEVAVGSPSQSFRMTFDTGSANVVIPSSHCSAPSCLQSRRYNASQSSTAERQLCSKDIEDGNYTREAVTLTFGTGQVTGHYAKDQVCVGQDLCAALSFVEATNQSEHPFLNAPYDGVLGLGLPQLSQDHGFCLFDELVTGTKVVVIRNNGSSFSFSTSLFQA